MSTDTPNEIAAAVGQPGEPVPAEPSTEERIAEAMKTHEQLRKDLILKLRCAKQVHGDRETAKFLGVHVDTLYSWIHGEHCPRDLRRVDTILQWAIWGSNVWDRAAVALMRECAREPQPERREEILKAIALNIALALREHGYCYEFKARSQNRPTVFISGPFLERCKLTFYLNKNLPFFRIMLPKGSERYYPDPTGILSLVDRLRDRQRVEIIDQERKHSRAAADEKLSRL